MAAKYALHRRRYAQFCSCELVVVFPLRLRILWSTCCLGSLCFVASKSHYFVFIDFISFLERSGLYPRICYVISSRHTPSFSPFHSLLSNLASFETVVLTCLSVFSMRFDLYIFYCLFSSRRSVSTTLSLPPKMKFFSNLLCLVWFVFLSLFVSSVDSVETVCLIF